jgi:ABC-type proline/glycine betaine transport system substrate-binding protein
MKIIKTTLVAGLISLFATFSTFAEKVKIGDPGWTGATAIANLLNGRRSRTCSRKQHCNLWCN